jgi:cytochrome b561
MGSDISSSQRYDAMSQCLHWLMAFLLIGMLVMGLTFDTIPEDWRKSAVTTHKATGVLLLGLVGVRVLWRFFRPAPPLLPASWFQRAMATLTHLTLYGLMVLIPLCGLMMIWGRGRAVDFFGLVEIPALIPENELGPIFYGWHVTGAYILIGLIGLHVLAVGYHWLIKKDTTLQRMTE